MNTVATIFIGIGAFLSVGNWLCLLSSLFRPRFVSPVFPAPSLLTTIGLALLDSTRPYWWIGLFTDYTLFGLLAATPRLITEAWRLSSFTRQQLLVADDGPRHFTLSLPARVREGSGPFPSCWKRPFSGHVRTVVITREVGWTMAAGI